jgi:uncharacterized protein (DUF58 family)
MRVNKKFWFISFFFIIFLTIAILTNEIILLRIFYFCAFLIIFSWFWAFYSLRGINLKRISRSYHLQVDMLFRERFEIINKFTFRRLWIELIDQSNIPGYECSRVIQFLGPKTERSYQSRTLLIQRGEFTLGPTILRSGDPFGFFTSERIFPAESKLIVLPKVIDLQEFVSPPGQLSGGRAIRKSTYEITPYAASVRDYQPGDSLNRVHWRSTAKRNRLMVKEFEQEPQANIWIFLDAQSDIQINQHESIEESYVGKYSEWQRKEQVELPVDTFEYGVCIAASLTKYFIRMGRAVGFVSSGKELIYFSSERGDRQFGKIVETLSYIKPDGSLPLFGLVDSQSSNLSRGNTVILITTTNQKNIDATSDNLIRRGMKVVLVILDAVTFGSTTPSQDIKKKLELKGVPVIMIQKGENLKNALSRV